LAEYKKNLAGKTALGLAGETLDSTARLLVGLLVTPFLTRQLGRDMYGAWMMINQLNGYVALGNFRLSGTVKYFLSRHQHSEDWSYKRRMVGAALLLVLWSLPLLLALIATLVVLVPKIFSAAATDVTQIRLALLITGALLLLVQFGSIPGNVLRGLNLDYKALGLKSCSLVVASLSGLGLVMLGWKLPGLAIGNLLGFILLSIVHLYLVRKYVPWFGCERPQPQEIRLYTTSSIWITVNSVGGLLLVGSDYVLVGLLLGPAEAAIYSVTAALARFLMSPLASLTSASNAGIAGLCGTGEWERVIRIKQEFYLLTLVTTGLIGTIVLFANQAFVFRWVGPVFYGGMGLTLIFLLQGLCTGLSQADGNVLDGLMAIREKALISIVAGIGAIACSIVFVQWLGMIGVALGMLLGRIGVVIYFQRYIYRRQVLRDASRHKSWRLLCCILGCWAAAYVVPHPSAKWTQLIPSCFIVGLIAATTIYIVGLDAEGRTKLTTRMLHRLSTIRNIFAAGSK